MESRAGAACPRPSQRECGSGLPGIRANRGDKASRSELALRILRQKIRRAGQQQGNEIGLAVGASLAEDTFELTLGRVDRGASLAGGVIERFSAAQCNRELGLGFGESEQATNEVRRHCRRRFRIKREQQGRALRRCAAAQSQRRNHQHQGLVSGAWQQYHAGQFVALAPART